MEIIIKPEWYEAMAEIESDNEMVGAGICAMYPEMIQPKVNNDAYVEEARIAFGQFVALARRSRKVSIEELAEVSDLDLAELLAIEQHDPGFIPEPRTVYQLASFFRVSYEKLMELAGLTRIRHASLTANALKFAARSASVADLSDHERQALEEFVVVLSEQADTYTH